MKTADFICLSYKKSDFLIEKDLINASTYSGQKKELRFSRLAQVLGREVQVINFDFLVNKAFHDEGISDECMILKIHERYFETSAEAFVKSIELKELKLFGSIMDAFCQQKGILAVRYIENNRIQYLLDAGKFLQAFEEDANDKTITG